MKSTFYFAKLFILFIKKGILIMGFIHDSIVNLSEELLDEDKMVKYDGELSPKFGWCVIYMGGGASGKSTATKYLSRLQGKYYNVDDFKENEKRWQLHNKDTGDTYESQIKTPEEDRDLGNPDFAGELHTMFSDVSYRLKQSMLHNPASNENRLPNMIFDMTGDKLSKIKEIVEEVKPLGYKVAIIWVLNTFERALSNISKRKRKGKPDLVAGKHLGVLNTAKELFNSGYIENIDEFWVIDAYSPAQANVYPVEYHDTPNVYHIPTTSEGLDKFEEVVNLINTTESQLNNYYNN